MSHVLTDCQQLAYAAAINLAVSNDQELVIEGPAGTGKTTLIKTFMAEYPLMCAISAGTFKELKVVLTATTNKAADALSSATGHETTTIHSYLGIGVVPLGYKKTKLVDRDKDIPDNTIIVIDEASFIDEELLKFIRNKLKRTNNKVIYLGDPFQLTPVGSLDTPVFSSEMPKITLSQIVRQADNSPIQALSVKLRGLVAGGPMPSAGVDGVNILHLPQEEFEKQFINDCKNSAGNAVRALAWTNQRAQYYNTIAAEAISGTSEIKLGDTVVLNKQITMRNKGISLKTDSTFYVADITDWETDSNGLTSRLVTNSSGIQVRLAYEMSHVEELIKTAYAETRPDRAYVLENTYADLRLMYASTVNKSQGSTYETVYIDLNDIGKCREKDQVNRMLYVAASRAKNKVVFTGDL